MRAARKVVPIRPQSRETIIDGEGPEPVERVSPPVIIPGCDPGKHCATHGSGPFHCCRCGAGFMPYVTPVRR